MKVLKLLMLCMVVVSCGDEKSEIQYRDQIPPPIPPITKYEPLPPPAPVPVPVPTPAPLPAPDTGPTKDECLMKARQQYPNVSIIEGNVANAETRMSPYQRTQVIMGFQLRFSIDDEQWCLILQHELSHTTHGRNELVADYQAIMKLRILYQQMSRRYDDRRLDRVAMKQYRWLARRPPSSTHPAPQRRLQVMRKAVKRQRMTQYDYYYIL